MLIPLRSDEPTKKAPIMTTLIIAVNITAFIYQQFSMTFDGRNIASIYGAIPYELARMIDIRPHSPYPVYCSLLTYMFLHGGFLHIIGNMLFLNAFAPNIEDIMGHFKFLIFYLLCGIIAAIVYIVPNFNSGIPLVGASGAIAGVMGAHLKSLPGTRIRCLVLIFRISLPAVVILFPWIVLQFANVIMREQTNIAFIAHVGGFIFGMIMANKFQNKWFSKRKKYNQNYLN